MKSDSFDKKYGGGGYKPYLLDQIENDYEAHVAGDLTAAEMLEQMRQYMKLNAYMKGYTGQTQGGGDNGAIA